MNRLAALPLLAFAASAITCSAGTDTTHQVLDDPPDVPGTIFTIVFENEDAANVLTPSNPFFYKLATEYARPLAYASSTHPSLPNYIMMTSGSTNGIINDSDPAYNVTLPPGANLADQLDAAKIPWRAYMESMGSPCNTESSDLYSAHHNPFVYSWLRMNTARCEDKIVDFDAAFAADLASNQYRYMWITPNMCNDVHNCPVAQGDVWLERVATQIMSSPGYLNGGALFILFDEGNSRLPGASATLPVIVVSPKLVKTPYVTSTPFDHRSYLATVEDIFGLPRLATTEAATSMGELFQKRAAVASADAPDASTID